MKVTVQVVIEPEDGQPQVIYEVAQLERDVLQPDTLGLHLDEAKDVLKNIQRTIVEQQAAVHLRQQANHYPHFCGGTEDA